jgi:hypothetical protein
MQQAATLNARADTTMSDIAIGIVADYRRHDQARLLYQRTKADIVCYDDGIIGCTNNHIRTWARLAPLTGEWGVVLEDDAEVNDDFREQLSMVLANPPADVVSLYLGKGFPRAWQRWIKPVMATDAHWVLSSHVLHGVGVAVRGNLIRDMLRFVGKMSPQEQLWPIDEQVTHWCRLRGHRVAYTKPSIVQHADGESIAVHYDGAKRDMPRVAWEFGSRLDWDKSKVVEMQ